MKSSVAFDPLLPIWLIITLTGVILITAMFAEWKGLKSFVLRAIAAFIICGALLNPQKLLEQRTPLPDVALILTDKSESMSIASRTAVAETVENLFNASEAWTLLRCASGADGCWMAARRGKRADGCTGAEMSNARRRDDGREGQSRRRRVRQIQRPSGRVIRVFSGVSNARRFPYLLVSPQFCGIWTVRSWSPHESAA